MTVLNLLQNVLTRKSKSNRPTPTRTSSSSSSSSIDSAYFSDEEIDTYPTSYRAHQRRALTFGNEYHEQLTMSANNIQDSPKTGDGGRNTGFPEPFNSERNTTLPHPEADTSANATIEAPNGMYSTASRPHAHTRRSFLHGHGHRSSASRKHSKGDSGISLGEAKSASMEKTSDEEGNIGPTEKADADGEETVEGKGLVAEERDDQGYLPGERKKGVLRKLNMHKV